jgi:hypothetical protein
LIIIKDNKDKNMTTPVKSECAICLENISKNTLCQLPKCKHHFHFECIGKWINERSELLKEEHIEERIDEYIEEHSNDEYKQVERISFCPCCRSSINIIQFAYLLKLNWLEGIKRQGFDITHAKFMIELGQYDEPESMSYHFTKFQKKYNIIRQPNKITKRTNNVKMSHR